MSLLETGDKLLVAMEPLHHAVMNNSYYVGHSLTTGGE